MKKITFICLFLFASLQARADLVMVQSVNSGEKSSEITVKIKGGKFRSDAPDKLSSVITDLNSGEAIKLLHFPALYIKFPVNKAAEKKQGDDAAKPPKLVDTGKQELVNGYDTEIFTAETATAKYTYWITRNYPDYAAVNGELKKFRTLENNLAKAGATFPDLSKLDGVVVRTKIVGDAGKTVTTTLVSAKVQPVDDSEFQIPAGYNAFPDDNNSPAPPPAPGTPAPGAATPSPKSKP